MALNPDDISNMSLDKIKWHLELMGIPYVKSNNSSKKILMETLAIELTREKEMPQNEQARRTLRISTSLFEAISTGNCEKVDYFLTNGVDINIVHRGHTVLSTAIWKYHVNMVSLLLHKGANVNAIDSFDYSEMTPLHRACLYYSMHPKHRHHLKEIIEMLLKFNASVDVQDYNGRTPVYHLREHSYLINEIKCKRDRLNLLLFAYGTGLLEVTPTTKNFHCFTSKVAKSLGCPEIFRSIIGWLQSGDINKKHVMRTSFH